MLTEAVLRIILTAAIGLLGWFIVYRHRVQAERVVESLSQKNLMSSLRYHNPALKESCAYHVIYGSLKTRYRSPLALQLTPQREAVMDTLAMGLLCAVTIELREPFLILSTLAECIRLEHKVSTSVFINDKGAMELVIREPTYELYYFVFHSKEILI